MIGDGVITPAISILSAVEGILLIPAYDETPQVTLLIMASLIAFALFAVQRKGIERVAAAFGPIMVIWFISIGSVGLWYVSKDLSIFAAMNPMYAINFTLDHPAIAFIIFLKLVFEQRTSKQP